MAEYIERKAVRCKNCIHNIVCLFRNDINDIDEWLDEFGCGDYKPAADVVELERYNDLREAFVDFVCSGVHNPAPYCQNRCDDCVDSRGWCTYRRCNGFNPDGKGENDG